VRLLAWQKQMANDSGGNADLPGAPRPKAAGPGFIPSSALPNSVPKRGSGPLRTIPASSSDPDLHSVPGSGSGRMRVPGPLPNTNQPPAAKPGSGTLHPVPGSGQLRAVPGSPSGIRPAASFGNTSGHMRSAGVRWNCSQCGAAMTVESVTSGMGKLLDGRLLCGKCVSKEARAKETSVAKSIAWPVLTVLLLLLAGGAVLFPAHTLFVGAMAGVLLVFAGGLGFTLRGITRLALGITGAAGAVLCICLLSEMSEKEQIKQAQSALGSDVSEIKKLLEEDAFGRAYGMLLILESRAANDRSSSSTALAASATKTMEEWVQRHYGSQTGPSRNVLVHLLKNYTFKTASGEKRIRSCHLNGRTAQLSAIIEPDLTSSRNAHSAASEQPAASSEDALLREAASMAASVLDFEPSLENVELQFFSVNAGDVETGVLDASRSALPILRSGDRNSILPLCRMKSSK